MNCLDSSQVQGQLRQRIVQKAEELVATPEKDLSRGFIRHRSSISKIFKASRIYIDPPESQIFCMFDTPTYKEVFGNLPSGIKETDVYCFLTMRLKEQGQRYKELVSELEKSEKERGSTGIWGKIALAPYGNDLALSIHESLGYASIVEVEETQDGEDTTWQVVRKSLK
jgi:hypothetical protein